MGRKILLSLVVASLVGALLLPVSTANAAACTDAQDLEGICGGSNGSGVDIGAGSTSPGTESSGEGSSPDDSSGTVTDITGPPCDSSCMAEYFATPGFPAAPGGPGISISDVATLVPVDAVSGSEPAGWAVTGLPSNFFGSAAPHVVSTTLLGIAADVRFTPVQFTWTTSDGAQFSSATGGATWAALGVPEFTETETSHTFEAEGDAYVDLLITYTAEFRFGTGPWLALNGTLSQPAPRIDLRVGSASTMIVDGECINNPSSPGCQ